MIGIIDYGLGNVKAFLNIYKQLNIPSSLVSCKEDILNSERLILPGVGSFDWAISRLENKGLFNILNDAILVNKIPILGVCVGMQIMAKSSEEGIKRGFGWIDGEVKRFTFKESSNNFLNVHMGWNEISTRRQSVLLKGIDEKSRFYFLHSYYFYSDHKELIIANSNYGSDFTCCLEFKNCYGVQFHPEKSHKWGIQLLKNFSEI